MTAKEWRDLDGLVHQYHNTPWGVMHVAPKGTGDCTGDILRASGEELYGNTEKWTHHCGTMHDGHMVSCAAGMDCIQGHCAQPHHEAL